MAAKPPLDPSAKVIPDALDVIVTLFATFFLVAVDPDVVVWEPVTTVSEPINPVTVGSSDARTTSVPS